MGPVTGALLVVQSALLSCRHNCKLHCLLPVFGPGLAVSLYCFCRPGRGRRFLCIWHMPCNASPIVVLPVLGAAALGWPFSRRKEEEMTDDDGRALASRMGRIKHKVMVLSGKGGVGKSTVAVNLAVALAMAGKQVGLLDIDVHGPSVPRLLRLADAKVGGTDSTLHPVEVGENLKVMSVGLLLHGRDEAVIWRGPMKYNVIRQFLKDVEWGDLDYLVVDSPPGTGDEPLTVAQLLGDPDGAVIVTTPQALAIQDVRRSVMFCRKLELPVLGVIENMSGFLCPKCGEHAQIFGSGGGRSMAEDMGVPFLGSIPIDMDVVASGDSGEPVVRSHPQSDAAGVFHHIVDGLLSPNLKQREEPASETTEATGMTVAIPVSGGALAAHFGHCEEFALFDVNQKDKAVVGRRHLVPPVHEPGVLPRWLHEQGAHVIIAGGMGSRAQGLFAENNITVVVGAANEDPERIVTAYLDGSLVTGANVCDH